MPRLPPPQSTRRSCLFSVIAFRLWRHRPPLMGEAANIDHRSGNRFRLGRDQEPDRVRNVFTGGRPSCRSAGRAWAEPRSIAADPAETHAADDAAAAGYNRIHANTMM